MCSTRLTPSKAPLAVPVTTRSTRVSTPATATRPASVSARQLAEEREGETFDQLLAEEEPDIDPYKEAGERDYGTAHPAGRLVAENEGLGEDDEPELVGTDVGYDGGAGSAEESAIHVIDEDNPTD